MNVPTAVRYQQVLAGTYGTYGTVGTYLRYLRYGTYGTVRKVPVSCRAAREHGHDIVRTLIDFRQP